MKRVLITGASGLLGRAVFTEFDSHSEWEVCGLAFSRISGNLVKADLNDEQQIKKIIFDFKPSIIIHTAAKRKPDEVEKQPEATHALNVGATHSICELALGIGAPVVYISTDYVFDGKSPPYAVDAVTNPLNKYGMSKLQGEHKTLGVSKDNIVLRVPVLYGNVEEIAESAVTCLFSAVTSRHNVMMSHYEIKFPTHVADVAKVLRDLSDKKLADGSLSGVFHWSGDERLTKYEQCLIMAENCKDREIQNGGTHAAGKCDSGHFRRTYHRVVTDGGTARYYSTQVFDLPSTHLTADKQPSGGAPRPHDPQLDTSKIRALGICHQRKFKDAIQAALQPHFKP